MQQQPCEPEDRLGSQSTTSVFRPNTRAIHARRSGFLSPPLHAGDGAEGASLTQRYWLGKYSQIPCPYRPELSNPEDTRHVDSEIPPEIHFCETVHGEEKFKCTEGPCICGLHKKSPTRSPTPVLIEPLSRQLWTRPTWKRPFWISQCTRLKHGSRYLAVAWGRRVGGTLLFPWRCVFDGSRADVAYGESSILAKTWRT